MLTGVEYVVAAYGIWVCTFLVYILMTNHRMKIAGQTVEAIKQKVFESSNNPDKTVSIENQD